MRRAIQNGVKGTRRRLLSEHHLFVSYATPTLRSGALYPPRSLPPHSRISLASAISARTRPSRFTSDRDDPVETTEDRPDRANLGLPSLHRYPWNPSCEFVDVMHRQHRRSQVSPGARPVLEDPLDRRPVAGHREAYACQESSANWLCSAVEKHRDGKRGKRPSNPDPGWRGPHQDAAIPQRSNSADYAPISRPARLMSRARKRAQIR